MNTALRQIPSIHILKNHPTFQVALSDFPIQEKEATELLRQIIISIRKEILSDAWSGPSPNTDRFLEYIFEKWKTDLHVYQQANLKRVINATGTVLHTNLGRAKLSKRAIQQIIEVAAYNSNLEFDLAKGERGKRTTYVEEKLKSITGAEAAYVVNNNAAAVYLILHALGKNKQVVISRGELIEIGGSFRISSIMEESGAHLKEVGTTNKTHLFDYENAINDETAILMKVHTSNFKTVGFTKNVATEELVQLSQQHDNLLFYEDLGSGALYPFQQHGIGEEEVVKDIVSKGVDLISFSGDKLLGGPQVGIIVGKKKYIDMLKKNQLARVLRVDKLNLAALEATLVDYLTMPEAIPTIHNICISQEALQVKASNLLSQLEQKEISCDIIIDLDESTIGGGTMPGVTLPTIVIALKPLKSSVQEWRDALQKQAIPIIVRIQQERILLDVRTIEEEEFSIIADSLHNLSKEL